MNTKPKKLRFAVLAVDVVILTVHQDKLQVLLIKVHRPPHFINAWGVPGGLIDPKETAEQAVKRHLWVKAGVKDVYLEQLYTFSRVDRDPRGRVVSVAYFALVPFSKVRIKNPAAVRWVGVDDLPKLAYDHTEIVGVAVARLKAKLEYTNIAYSLMEDEFALSDLQKAYEAILRRKLDKRNFRKKLFALELLKPTRRHRRGEAHRPAELYRFVERKPRVVEVL